MVSGFGLEIFFGVVGVAIIVAALLWYALPIFMTRKHNFVDHKERLHLQDRLRKTVGTAIAGASLSLPLILTSGQYVLTQFSERQDKDRQYIAETKENDRKHLDEISKQFSEAMTAYAKLQDVDLKNADLKIQAIFDLERTASIAIQYNGTPEHFIVPVVDNLRRLIKELAKDEKISLSTECNPGEKNTPDSREESDHRVQAAMGSLGRLIRTWGQLRPKAQLPIHLNHLFLDNINMSQGSFAGIYFANSWFRRADMKDSHFERANFNRAHFAYDEVPGFNQGVGEAIIKGTPEYERRKYRCWIADFRGANLTDAVFRNATLSGADFTGAELSGADFTGAKLNGARFKGAKNISRADFSGSDITQEQKNSAYKE